MCIKTETLVQKGSVLVLAVVDGRARLDQDSNQGLETAPPAPGGGTEALGHHGTISLKEYSETITAHQDWCLRDKDEDKQVKMSILVQRNVCMQ